MGQYQSIKTTAVALACCTVLSGCMGHDIVSRAGFGMGGDDPVAATGAGAPAAALNGELSNGERSPIIDALLNRRSVLPAGPYAQVADAVLAANARAAEAELRAAMLRSEARELNWLPSLGPTVSLNSLGAVVAGLVIEQSLFDGGARRAEREFARADVEVAAVALAQDSNERVYQGLDLYLTIQAAEARAAVHSGAMARMERFEYVMAERVRVGVNDRADLQVVQQKLTQMRSDMMEDREAARAARAELAAMSSGSLDGVSGIASISDPAGISQPLDVMQVAAQGTRSLAEARAHLAGYTPNVTASGTLGQSGSAGLNIGLPNGLSFGRGAEMGAIEAMSEAAELQIAEQREDSARDVAAIEGRITSLRRQLQNTETIIAQARDNYTLFDEQLRAGQRTVPEVVSVFRTKLDAEREAVAIRYDLARMELQLARIYGNLVDGEDI